MALEFFRKGLIPGRLWVHLPATMGYDRYPEAIIDEKKSFLQDKLARSIHLFFTHEPECAIASVTQNDRRAFVTADEMKTVDVLSP